MDINAVNFGKLPLDKLYIDGAWVTPQSTARYEVISPRSEAVIASVADAGPADVDAAVAAARMAFDNGPWSHLSFKERADWLQRLQSKIEERKDDLASAWSQQIGIAPARAAMMAPYFSKTLDSYIAIARAFEIEQERRVAGAGEGWIRYEPVGVVAAIAPWNVPTSTMLNKVAPALLAGCSIIIKPAPETPAEGYIIAECADQIGLPAGVLNLISAGREGSDNLVRHRDVDKVSFTGSVATGRHIAAICGGRIARFTMELGGKSAAIILDDYPLEKAAKILIDGICTLSGQNCAALSRVIVGRDRQDELVAHLKLFAEQVVIGDLAEPAALGPVATKRQLHRIESYIAKGVEEGATLVTGGKRPDGIGKGYFIKPTIFANVESDMIIAQEEIFGPVLSVIPSDSIEDSIRIANHSVFGLAGAVFTNDADQAKYVARRFRTGTISQNSGRADFGIGFGGFKQSGYGREGGMQGFMAYLEPKTMLLETP